MPTSPTWVEHSTELVRVVAWIGSALVGTILLMGAAFIKVALYVGNKFAARIDNIEHKIDTMHQIQLMCDGCSSAADAYKRRSTDKL